MKLIEFMGKACHYAQEYICCDVAWSQDKDDREYLLQCTSYQMACFLAQNTVHGNEGVDWNIIIDKLSEPGVKSATEWEDILMTHVIELGGWA